MKAKNQFLAAVSLTFLLTACRKDLSLKDEVQGEAVSSDVSANDVVETAPPVYKAVTYNVNSNVAGFVQGVPARYNLTTKKYPLIVFIHGIGELGTGPSRLACCGLPHHLKNKTFPANFRVNGVNYSFLVIAPQFKRRPSAAQVQSVIDFAKRRWRVDASRIYVAGLSMGGGSTWDWAAVYGQNAAAIVPVCGGTKPNASNTAGVASKNLPIWGLYSTRDKLVPAQWGRDFFSLIDRKNPSYASRTKLTIWTDTDHNGTWARALNPNTRVDGMNVYQWMLLYKRGSSAAAPSKPSTSTGSNKAPIARAGGDRSIYLRQGINRVTLDGTTSNDPDGKIVKYTWTKMSGPAYKRYDFATGKMYAAHLVAGTYVFRLGITDNRGATSYDDVRVVVHPWSQSPVTNKTPVARAGMDQTIYLRQGINRVTLDGTKSSDADGSIVRYTWRKVSGPKADLYTFAKGKTYAAHLVRGTYRFEVIVTDNKGKTAADSKVVYVK
jgi:poly(3-hydroxybutyrate) depolymerase